MSKEIKNSDAEEEKHSPGPNKKLIFKVVGGIVFFGVAMILLIPEMSSEKKKEEVKPRPQYQAKKDDINVNEPTRSEYSEMMREKTAQVKTEQTPQQKVVPQKPAISKKEIADLKAARSPLTPNTFRRQKKVDVQNAPQKTQATLHSANRQQRQIVDPGNKAQEYITQNAQAEKTKFLRETKGPHGMIDDIQEPVSPFTVFAGTMLPAALLTGINSDLPGNLSAVVSQNVYDSATGNHLLIPQGTKILGAYSSAVSYGQHRALIVWNRMIYPNGDSVDLGTMPGVDLQGMSGFEDIYDRHFWLLMSDALLLSVIEGVGNLVANLPLMMNTDGTDITVGTQPTNIATQLVRKDMNVQPTIIIRPGYLFNVYILKDLVLRPYEENSMHVRFPIQQMDNAHILGRDHFKQLNSKRHGPRIN